MKLTSSSQIQKLLDRDDDGVLTIIRGKDADDPLKTNTFWFRPVDGNMAHHTLVGERPVAFDFLAQPIKLIKSEFNQDGSPSSVTAVLSAGKPVTCMLANIPFQQLSESLYVWFDVECGYRVSMDL